MPLPRLGDGSPFQAIAVIAHPLVVMELSRKEEVARRHRRGSSVEEGGGRTPSSSWKQRRGRRRSVSVGDNVARNAETDGQWWWKAGTDFAVAGTSSSRHRQSTPLAGAPPPGRCTSSSRCSSNRLEQRAKIQGIGSWTAERTRRLRTVEGTRQCVWMRTLLLCMRFFIRASHATVVRIFDPRAQFGFARAVLFSFWYRLFYANCNTSFFSNHYY
jgi:hypothetical protein